MTPESELCVCGHASDLHNRDNGVCYGAVGTCSCSAFKTCEGLVQECEGLSVAVVTLGLQLKSHENALDAKHKQWQAAVAFGEEHRARRLQIEADVRELQRDLLSEDHETMVLAECTLEDRLTQILHPTEPAEQLPYPETVEADWRNACGVVTGSILVLGWEPEEYESLEEETKAASEFLERFEGVFEKLAELDAAKRALADAEAEIDLLRQNVRDLTSERDELGKALHAAQVRSEVG